MTPIKNRGKYTWLIYIGIVIIIYLLFLPATFLHVTPLEIKISRVKNSIQSLSTMLELFRAENSFYPESLEVLADPNAETRVYIKTKGRRLLDPWGKPYIYLKPDKYGELFIFSLGPDGIPSQDDIGNWQLKD